MRLHAIPPVRRAVPVGRADPRRGKETLTRYFDGKTVTAFGSGTQALTAALIECAGLKPTKAPNAIIPAYGCPDLVSACLCAGVAPVLVDVSAEGWGYDLTLLDAAINADTVAVVAVNLLGLQDADSEFLRLVRSKGARVISDSAQHLPRSPTESVADYQVYSFGRGKPLNLLGGGALVGPVASHDRYGASAENGLKQSRIAGLFFNLATLPCVYPWLQLAMAGGIGETRYRAPVSPVVSRSTWQRLSAAMPAYLSAPTYSSAAYLPYLEVWQRRGIVPLQSVANRGVQPEPLRLAMTARTQAQRDDIVTRLSDLGMGASAMYGTSLPKVNGIPEVVKGQGSFPNAESLASRLFTLPTHRQVTAWRAARIARAIHEVLPRQG